jgi:hypothetical protein
VISVAVWLGSTVLQMHIKFVGGLDSRNMNRPSFLVGRFPPFFREYQLIASEFMHAHLRKSKIEDLVSDHTAGFLDTIITVEVSAGEVFRPMRLNTNTFAPSTAELLQQNYLLPAEMPLTSQLVRVRSVPIGIMCLSPSDIKRKCKNYIEEMISNPQYADQATAGDMSQLPKQILRIVCAYAAAQKDVRIEPKLSPEEALTKILGLSPSQCVEAARNPLLHELPRNFHRQISSRSLRRTRLVGNTTAVSLLAPPEPPNQVRDAQTTPRNHAPRPRRPGTLSPLPNQGLLGSLILHDSHTLPLHRALAKRCRHNGRLRHAGKRSCGVVHARSKLECV